MRSYAREVEEREGEEGEEREERVIAVVTGRAACALPSWEIFSTGARGKGLVRLQTQNDSSSDEHTYIQTHMHTDTHTRDSGRD